MKIDFEMMELMDLYIKKRIDGLDLYVKILSLVIEEPLPLIYIVSYVPLCKIELEIHEPIPSLMEIEMDETNMHDSISYTIHTILNKPQKVNLTPLLQFHIQCNHKEMTLYL